MTQPATERARPPLKPAYLILGDDLPKVELALKRLKARIASNPAATSTSRSSMQPSTAGRRWSTPPTPWPSSAAPGWCWSDRCRPGSRPTRTLIAAYLKSPAPDACLTLVAEKLPPTDVLRAAMEKHGEVLEYQAPKEGQLPQWLVTRPQAVWAWTWVSRSAAHGAAMRRQPEHPAAGTGEAADLRRRPAGHRRRHPASHHRPPRGQHLRSARLAGPWAGGRQPSRRPRSCWRRGRGPRFFSTASCATSRISAGWRPCGTRDEALRPSRPNLR